MKLYGFRMVANKDMLGSSRGLTLIPLRRRLGGVIC